MKKINEMSVKELREVAKEMNISGRWDMTKAQLVEAIEKVEAEKKAAEEKAAKKKVAKETKKSKAIKIQRAFVEVAEARKETYRYITITVNNLDEEKASDYVDAVVSKMNEMYDFEGDEGTFNALRCPDFDDEKMSYTDMISFEKCEGHIKEQLKYVGKMMTKAMKALK